MLFESKSDNGVFRTLSKRYFDGLYMAKLKNVNSLPKANFIGSSDHWQYPVKIRVHTVSSHPIHCDMREGPILITLPSKKC